MLLKDWNLLPEYMQIDALKPYYNYLSMRKSSLLVKRVFDIVGASILLVILSPIMLLLSCIIVLDSKGSVFFVQERVTQYGKRFQIIKFRTMAINSEGGGSQVTTKEDSRVTNAGRVLRKYRLDELPQLLNIIKGEMSFCGVRPEVPRYVERYEPEMYATLLLPAGVTSEASIRYKDEEDLLSESVDIEREYIEKILPKKMEYNLASIKNFSLKNEAIIILKTLWEVFR